MDRLSRVLATGGMALILGTVLTGSGCRSMRSEVPPGKPTTMEPHHQRSGSTPIPGQPPALALACIRMG